MCYHSLLFSFPKKIIVYWSYHSCCEHHGLDFPMLFNSPPGNTLNESCLQVQMNSICHLVLHPILSLSHIPLRTSSWFFLNTLKCRTYYMIRQHHSFGETFKYWSVSCYFKPKRTGPLFSNTDSNSLSLDH